MSERQAYIDKMHAQLDAADARIKKLQATAKNATADSRIELQRRLDELRAQRKTISEKMNSLQNATADSWSDVKSGFERAWGEFKSSVESAANRF